MTKMISFNPWLSENKDVDGWVGIEDMPNLLASQAKKSGKIYFTINIDIGNSERSAELNVSIKASLDFICQRCMKLIKDKEFAVDASFLILKSDRNKATDNKNIDIIICEKKICIASLIEQELILSVPMIAKHKSCEMSYENKLAEKERNPFADLMNIKLKK